MTGAPNGEGGAPDLLNSGDAPSALPTRPQAQAAAPVPNPMDRHSY